MATKTIGQLTQATTINNVDEFAIEQSGVTKRVAASVVRGDIVNANIKSDAAIAYSKLNLSGQIANSDVSASAAIAHNKLANITAGHVLLGSATNVPTATAISGDVAITSSGVATVGLSGTWTPSLGGNATYTSRSGAYFKIGKLVYIKFILQVNTIGTGSATTISGLPFASDQTTVNRDYITCGFFSSMNVNMTSLAFFADGTNLSNTYVASAGASTTDTGAIFKNGAYVIAAGCYLSA